MHNRLESLHLLALTLLVLAAPNGFGTEKETPRDVLDRVWDTAKEHIYSDALAERFTDEQYALLAAQASESKNVYELAPEINRFLQSLGVSHTRFVTDRDIDYYVYRSLFTTRELNAPLVRHIGAQYARVAGEVVVREVFDAYPAAVSGLRRGDVIEKAEGTAFSPWDAFNASDKSPVRLQVRRGDKTLVVPVHPVNENPHLSLLRATQSSYRSIPIGGHRVGYVHLWAGTHDEILEAFRSIVLDEFTEHDGLIVDLRGGFGGAWYDYIDPFFPDRADYWTQTIVDRHGTDTRTPEPQENARFFSGPMVVLINGGTRSGKEALAYQFRKSGRATLIGTTTEGAFTGGMGVFADEDKPYILYLAVLEILLDSHTIEGVGVPPDVEVSYPLTESTDGDPQLKAAIEHLTRYLSDQ